MTRRPTSQQIVREKSEQPTNLGRILRFAVLQRDQAGSLRVVDALPDWWSDKIGTVNGREIILKADLLIDFMCDAEGVWNHSEDSLVASPVIELHLDTQDIQLQALAAKQGDQDLLIVRNLSTIDTWLSQTLRTARAHLLQTEKDRSGYQREVAEIAADRDEVQRLEQIKSEFFANMSHEIRTPLTTILGMASMAREAKSPEQQQGYFDALDSAANRLLRLSNDILDLSRFQAERLKLDAERFSLWEFLADFARESVLQAETKSLQFKLTHSECLPVEVIGDQFRLRQVLSNLVNNAIKFTDHGSVEVSVSRVSGSEDALLRFCVADTGVGIPSEHQSSIFQMFTQVVASSRRHHHGAGLGLAIATNLVHLMGGELTVESRLGKGSVFCFTASLPAAGAAASAESMAIAASGTTRVRDTNPPRSRAANGSDVLRVLVAEDHELNRSIIVETLRAQRFEVVEVGDGRSAVEAWRHEDLDVILMDCQMPIMSGLDAIALIRSEEKADARIPIIAITARAMQGDRLRLLESGADRYLAKPFDRAELIRVIEEVSNRSG